MISDFDDFDIILAMDDNNYHNILNMATDIESQNKVFRMADFLSNHLNDHIPDPYYSGADGFELVLDLLEDGCASLLTKIMADNFK